LAIISSLMSASEYFSGDHSQVVWIIPQRTMRGMWASCDLITAEVAASLLFVRSGYKNGCLRAIVGSRQAGLR
jgi:hypothetical protein